MLKEIEMSPRFLDRVVYGAPGGFALRAVEAAACLEIELDVEALLAGVEGGGRHEPRRRDAERELKQVIVAHEAPLEIGAGSILAPTMPPCRPALKDKPSRARKCASLTAARPVGATLRQQDQAALRPLSSPEAPTQIVEEAKSRSPTDRRCWCACSLPHDRHARVEGVRDEGERHVVSARLSAKHVFNSIRVVADGSAPPK